MKISQRGTPLRTDETWQKYKNTRKPDGCFMCDPTVESIMVWSHWRIISNNFPYDAVAETHHLLVPLQHIQADKSLFEPAVEQLEKILTYLDGLNKYDAIIKNFTTAQSHPIHLHYHLVTWLRHDK